MTFLTRQFSLARSAMIAASVLGLAGLSAMPASAQRSTSRAVVQPLPTKDLQRLNRALIRLANNPRSVDAMIEAGDAALSVDDLEAAMGFYGRAEDLSPNNPRIKLGMASVYLRSGRPVEALPFFAAAQSAGAETRDFLSDRGLAFDLIGDAESAQAVYVRAIAINPSDNEAKRRLALSYAISGNRAGFEDTLRPLLDQRDFGSFRARAFGLAILGEQDRAAAIVDAVMPRDLARRITPYLEFMPRLTKAQQAAAANIGVFPRAADIGREDPRIAAYVGAAGSPAAAAARDADSKLEPAGEPLGNQTQAAADAATTPVQPAQAQIATAQPEPAQVQTAQVQPAQSQPRSQPARAEPAGAQPASVADAFADIGSSAPPKTDTAANAVDLGAIQIPREAAPAPAEPAKPDHPSRIWVQVATGQDMAALKFDWARLSRRVPELLGRFEPHVTPWGQANRLLAGPVANLAEARDLINALKQEGVDTFRFTSPEGTEIKQLK